MKKILLLFLLILFMPDTVFAINISRDMWGHWAYNGSTDAGGSAGSFVIAGGLGMSGMHGTWGDEWAVVGIIANKIVEHGGYFCPYQLQCANKWNKSKAWTQYYWPNGFSYGKCAWLCETGYAGENCQPQTSTPATCDSSIHTTASGGKFSGISLKTSGKDGDQKEGEINGFNSWYGGNECDVILGVTKFLQHGVIAAPVRVCCGKKKSNSYVENVYLAAAGVQQKLLCANGYKANAAGTDCEPITEECKIGNMTFCTNFPKNEYDPAIHRLDDTSSDCAKYFCSEPDTAFPAVGDRSCIECSTGVKGGANTTNGVCVKCQTGEYFDQKSNSCKSAAAYSKSDMQYGKGQTKNTVAVEDQCWTKVDPQDYADCVKGIKKPTLVRSDLPLLQAVPAVTKVPMLSNYKLNQTTLKIAQ